MNDALTLNHDIELDTPSVIRLGVMLVVVAFIIMGIHFIFQKL